MISYIVILSIFQDRTCRVYECYIKNVKDQNKIVWERLLIII